MTSVSDERPLQTGHDGGPCSHSAIRTYNVIWKVCNRFTLIITQLLLKFTVYAWWMRSDQLDFLSLLYAFGLCRLVWLFDRAFVLCLHSVQKYIKRVCIIMPDWHEHIHEQQDVKNEEILQYEIKFCAGLKWIRNSSTFEYSIVFINVKNDPP